MCGHVILRKRGQKHLQAKNLRWSENSTNAKRRIEWGSPHIRQSITFNNLKFFNKMSCLTLQWLLRIIILHSEFNEVIIDDQFNLKKELKMCNKNPLYDHIVRLGRSSLLTNDNCFWWRSWICHNHSQINISQLKHHHNKQARWSILLISRVIYRRKIHWDKQENKSCLQFRVPMKRNVDEAT